MALVLAVVAGKAWQVQRQRTQVSAAEAGVARAQAEGVPALIYFHRDLCTPCRQMESLFNVLEREYRPRVEFVSAGVDDPATIGFAERLGIRSAPAFVLLDGKGEQRAMWGITTAADLRRELDAALVARP